uniref:Uncharacterized protein n=1 Tax=Arundo donax TaxID=35708 RepID=A0A0A9CLM9_ARUDO
MIHIHKLTVAIALGSKYQICMPVFKLIKGLQQVMDSHCTQSR